MIYPHAKLHCNSPASTQGLSAKNTIASLLWFSDATRAPYSYPSILCEGKKSPLSSMDSDLEAFSHNPADGSFAAMPDQTAAKTNYPNELFLSY